MCGTIWHKVLLLCLSSFGWHPLLHYCQLLLFYLIYGSLCTLWQLDFHSDDQRSKITFCTTTRYMKTSLVFQSSFCFFISTEKHMKYSGVCIYAAFNYTLCSCEWMRSKQCVPWQTGSKSFTFSRNGLSTRAAISCPEALVCVHVCACVCSM